MDNHNRKKKTVDDTVCEIHKFSGYAVLSNCFVRSTNLSWSAIGLLARVMDFPHEWNFSKAGLIAICPDGETAIDTALSELKEWGYLEIKTLMPNESSTGRIQPGSVNATWSLPSAPTPPSASDTRWHLPRVSANPSTSSMTAGEQDSRPCSREIRTSKFIHIPTKRNCSGD